MKKFIATLILFACVPAAFAVTAPTEKFSDLSTHLRNRSDWYIGMVVGVAQSDDNVCSGVVSFATMASSLADVTDSYLEKYPAKDINVNTSEEAVYMKTILEALYPCK